MTGGFKFTDFLGGGSISGGINDVGGAVADLFSSEGDKAEAGNYERAAMLARQEAQFTKSSVNVQDIMATRQITQALGQEQAGYAASGLTGGGSAGDVLRASAQQGALTKGLIQYQGAETEYGLNEQAASYDAMAEAAKKASEGGIFGAVLKGAGAAANFATAGGTSSLATMAVALL
ncbi:MAG TPA: hypothetical protein VKS78_04290 [Roseiarcus sp.]|nr:hypothetical protein [Roseiarcus sp.]